MSLYYRYKRWRGHDTTVEITHKEDLYKYSVEHLDGDLSTDLGNTHRRDEGFLLIEEKNDDSWARATVMPHKSYTGPPLNTYKAYDTVRELEGIKEVIRTRVGYDKWTFTVDKADGSHTGPEKVRVIE
jgi:hypothetical protein